MKKIVNFRGGGGGGGQAYFMESCMYSDTHYDMHITRSPCAVGPWSWYHGFSSLSSCQPSAQPAHDQPTSGTRGGQPPHCQGLHVREAGSTKMNIMSTIFV